MAIPKLTRALLLVGVLVLAITIAACGGSEDSTSSSADATSTAAATTAPNVVASTSWVGAVAKLAGATNITVIAPSNLQHPPDYDAKASDLLAVADADYVLLAGYEGFAEKLKEAAGSDATVEVVAPDYDPTKLNDAVMALATTWGTTDVATANMAQYTESYTQASDALKQKLSGETPVVVAQAFVANWVGFAGLEPAGVYGPEPLTPSQVAKLAKLKPAYVFENGHMPGGAAVVNAVNAKQVDLVNFPGDDLELMPVVEKNAATIAAAFGK